MKRLQAFIFGAALLAVVFGVVACSQEMSSAEIQAEAKEMGMMTKAEADAMSQGAMMSDDDVMAKAKEMGMMTKEEADAMMPMAGNRLEQVMGRDKVICASRNDVPGYGSIDPDSKQQRWLRH